MLYIQALIARDAEIRKLKQLVTSSKKKLEDDEYEPNGATSCPEIFAIGQRQL